MTKKTKKPLPQAARLALFAALAAGCATVLQPTPGWSAATMSAEDCQELPLEELMQAVNDGICTIDVLPAAGPAQVADRGTTGEHENDRDPPGGGGGGGNPDDGDDGEGDDGEGDDGDDGEGDDNGEGPCYGGNNAAARSGDGARDSAR